MRVNDQPALLSIKPHSTMLPDHDTLHVPQYEPQEALLREYCKNNPVPALSAPPGWSSSVAGMAWESQDLLERHINHLKKEECAEIFDACAGYIGNCHPGYMPYLGTPGMC
jgi:hypothetical protein